MLSPRTPWSRWRAGLPRRPLCRASALRTSSGDRSTAGGSDAGIGRDARSVDLSTLVPQSDGLFVHRVGEVRSQTIWQINRCHAPRQWHRYKASAAGWGFVLAVDCSLDSTTGASSAFAFRPYPNSARQRNKALVASLCARATAETLFLGCSHSSTMASFPSLVKLRRLVRPSRAETAAVTSVKSRSTTDALAALLALVLICGRALG